MKRLFFAKIALYLLCASASGAWGQTPADNAHDFNVSVTSTWTTTGMEVAASDTLLIYAQGTISDGAGNWNDWFGPDGANLDLAGGCVDCPLPGYPKVALIARIGGGDPFYVGSFRSFVCDAGGELYLGVNDNTPGDNLGTLHAFVWGSLTEPAPPDTTCPDCVGPPCSAGTNFLGSLSGDTGAEVLTDSYHGEEWLRFYLTEEDNLITYLSATIELTSPAGTDYDLYVYCNSCAGNLAGSSTLPGSSTDIVQVRTNDDFGADDSMYIIIRVKCSSVFSPYCNDNWNLTITGHTVVSNETCN